MTAPKPPVKTRLVLFDVGDTLVQPRQTFEALLAELAGEAGITLPEGAARRLGEHIDASIAERSMQGRPFSYPPEASARFWTETYLGFLSNVLHGSEAKTLAELLRAQLSSPAGYALFPDVLPALRSLHESGFRLGVVSNWESWLPDLLAEQELARWFEYVIVSGISEVEKPDPRIFSLALEASGVAPETTVYVGDRPAHDVGPAWAAGIRPVLLDRYDRYRHHEAWRRISSLTELLGVL